MDRLARRTAITVIREALDEASPPSIGDEEIAREAALECQQCIHNYANFHDIILAAIAKAKKAERGA